MFILISIFIVSCSFLNTNIILNYDEAKIDQTKNIFKNKSRIKNADTYNLGGGLAVQYTTWGNKDDVLSIKFSTYPQVKLQVWLIDKKQFDNLDNYFNPVGELLTVSTEEEILYTLPYESFWHLMFFNNLSTSTTMTYTITISPHIVITSPNFSTEVFVKSNLKIKWESNIENEPFKVDLYKGNDCIKTLTEDIRNYEFEYYNVSEGLVFGTDYRIKVTAISSGEEDFSDSFAIIQRKFGIITPKKDKILIPHTNETIKWYSIGIYTDVRIDLCLNFTPILEINDNTENNYSYTWNVWQGDNYSNTTHSNYQIRIQNINTPEYVGFSQSFTITDEKFIQIQPISINSSYKSGEEIRIIWKTNYNNSNIRIELRENSQTIQYITTTSSNLGSFTWEIPSNIKSGDNYRIFIITSDNSTYGYSDSFTLKGTNKSLLDIPLGFYLLIISIIFIVICVGLVKKRNVKISQEKEKFRIRIENNKRIISFREKDIQSESNYFNSALSSTRRQSFKSDSNYLLEIKDIVKKGDLLKAENDFENAINIYRTAIPIIKLLGNQKAKTEDIQKITDLVHLVKIQDKVKEGKQFKKVGKFNRALHSFKACISIAEMLNDKDIQTEQMQEITELINNYNL